MRRGRTGGPRLRPRGPPAGRGGEAQTAGRTKVVKHGHRRSSLTGAGTKNSQLLQGADGHHTDPKTRLNTAQHRANTPGKSCASRQGGQPARREEKMNAATGPGAGMKDQTLQRERTGPEEGEIQALGGACRMVYQKDGNRNRRDIQDLETGRLCDARKWVSSRTDAGILTGGMARRQAGSERDPGVLPRLERELRRTASGREHGLKQDRKPKS